MCDMDFSLGEIASNSLSVLDRDDDGEGFGKIDLAVSAKHFKQWSFASPQAMR